MGALWTDRSRYARWIEVERAVCEQLYEQGKIPKAEWEPLKEKLDMLIRTEGLDPRLVEKKEKITRHDVIAFTTALSEHLGKEARYVHYGLTSSDVVDTALSLLIQKAGCMLVKDLEALCEALKQKALETKSIPTIGRSHGIAAEPTSFGLKFLGSYCEWQRNLERLRFALEDCRFGKLSGAVGVNSHFDPETEAKILKGLGLKREPVATQVIPRDRHAMLLGVFAVMAGSMERLAVEFRHLQRTEVNEAQEGFSKGQKGSSAMPHKKNPISSENLTGCARLLRSYASAQFENIALWHERDISHSSVERITIPDAFILADYAIDRLSKVVKQLVIQQDRIQANLQSAGPTVFSGHVLMGLVEAGAQREEAYYWVQACAHEVLENHGTEEQFREKLAAHPKIQRYLSKEEIDHLGSLPYQLRSIDAIFKSVLSERS